MGLSESLDEARQMIVQKANSAIINLTTIANSQSLEMNEVASRLQDVREDLACDTFKLIVVGRFKTGKSSLLNALLGPPLQAQPELQNKGPMPVDDLPTTATLTSIEYSEQPYVRVWYTDENREPEYWSLERYLRDAVVRDDEEETKQFFENIRQFELGYPAKLCKSVTLLDSPGTSDMPLRTKWTREAVRRCDAAIVLYRSDVLAGEDERNFAKEVLVGGTRVFTLINLWNGKKPDERLRAFAWNRLVAGDNGGEKYNGQDFTAHDIYFIDALKAEQGKFSGNHQLIEESGLTFFESRLAEFLLQEKFQTHIETFVRRADNLAVQIEEAIETRCYGLQQTAEKLAQTYETIKPKLEEVKKRKDKLSKIFDRYESQCQTELQLSFSRMINALREDLPNLLKARPLESLQGLGGTIKGHFSQKAACEEATNICESIITSHIEAWAENPSSKEGVQRTLEPILQRLYDEITEEVAKIETNLQDIRFQMTDWQPGINAPKSTTSLIERILCAGAGLALGDVTLIFGGAGGLRGLLGSLGGAFVAGIGIGIAAIMGAPITFPAVVIAAIIGSLTGSMTATRAGLEGRIKEKVLELAQEKLQNIPQLATENVTKEVRKTFEQLKSLIVNEVSFAIRQEEEKIQKMLEDNQRSLEDKQHLLASLMDTKQEIVTQRKVFNDIRVWVQQLG